MARGVIIFGPSCAGKTTLGRLLAARLGFPYFDIDDYIWRRDTPKPYTVMYSREEKIGRLMHDISQGEHFVMAGSMSSFHEHFDPLFDFGVFLRCDTEVRIARADRRAAERFGDRIREGGDLFDEHRDFLDKIRRYDTDGSPNLSEQLVWAKTMGCPVLELRGEDAPEDNCERAAEEYFRVMGEA